VAGVAGSVIFQRARDLGGGYTTLAMVADNHPMTQPKKTKTNVCTVWFLPTAATTAKTTAQTTAQPML
jgi:hypothetical protein